MSNTSPVDQSKLRHDAPAAAPREARVGELLFEFLIGHDRHRCELRDHGAYGVEAQFLINEELAIAHVFHQRLDPNRTPREMATAWANEWRACLEAGRQQPKTPLLQSVMRQLEEEVAATSRARQLDGRPKPPNNR